MIKKNPIDCIRMDLPNLSTRLQAAARYVINNQYDVVTHSMREIAAAAAISPATFTRLARAVNYTGWEALREDLIEYERANIAAPFSSRLQYPSKRNEHGEISFSAEIAREVLLADTVAVQQLDPVSIDRAAKQIMQAPRIWLAGFRSCHAIAQSLHYQLRLFRPKDIRLIGAGTPEDLDMGAIEQEDTIILISFAPYSRSIVGTARMAQSIGCKIIAIVDSLAAPITEGACHVLLFSPAQSPGFFPSLTGAFAIVQALVSASFAIGGEDTLKQLHETEKRLSKLSTFVSDKKG
ncbi:RpiR family transcriptional regulator [Acetobacter senegalensis]|uniref:RpiR family transcriptional regulator n=1 Tax=Acetobacter senegalensis TaxID=446692 RepID=A0A0U5BB97_9PROT|nr:MurR/RpiR family transcriptional regulator [Acetobacter senegalensis]CEF41877.1 RpiR family transcriptional regulator [Acetobacter senegalensis]